jgi:hypothetical protein
VTSLLQKTFASYFTKLRTGLHGTRTSRFPEEDDDLLFLVAYEDANIKANEFFRGD